MKLFIIGNGFDLAHSLETKYEHFRDYLEREHWEFLSSLEEMYGFRIGSFIEHIGEDIWEENVKEYLWQDFESNLSNIDETILDNGEDIELGLESGDIGIEDTLNEYWEERYKFIEELSEYVKEWISQIDINIDRKTELIDENSEDIYLTFNYSLVLEEVYGIDDNNILHIHGSILKSDISPVMGHGNKQIISDMNEIASEAREMLNEKKYSIYNAGANYCERTLKEIGLYISMNRNFFRNLENVDEILIIGHSLGDVDMPYFREIRRNVSDDVIWNVYYYSDNDMLTYRDKIISIGVKKDNIRMIHSSRFFN